MPATPALTTLRADWKTLYTRTLPTLASTRSRSQPHWVVHLDHCFARIIYDAIIGQSTSPWPTKLKSPAITHMSESQMQACLAMGQGIADGSIDLAGANQKSLAVREKSSGGSTKKRKAGDIGAGRGRKEEGRGKKQRRADIHSAFVADTSPTTPTSHLVSLRHSSAPSSTASAITSSASTSSPP